MIAELLILTGIYGISYNIWRQEKRKSIRQRLKQQQQRTQALMATAPCNDEMALEVTPKRISKRSKKDLAVIIAAITVASGGYWLYPPLAYIVPPLVFYAARHRFHAAFKQVQQGRVGVETLSVIGITGAMIGQRFFIGSLLTLVNALGDILTGRVIKDSHHQLVDLHEGIPHHVWLLQDGGIEHSISFDQVRAGDVLTVSSGETVPADGRIVWGVAAIDEHRFTGEAIPAEKGVGDEVYAMTLVLAGKVHFEVEKAGHETSAMKIADILNHTADYKSSVVLESQALSRQLVKPVLIASALVYPLFGFSAAIGMLFAHPKERLQLSAPISLMRYLKQAMSEGILIKDGRSLELLHQVDTIVFDKTGTLTEEQPQVGTIHTFSVYDADNILSFAAVAEHKQPHPIAQAVRLEAERRGIAQAEPGHSKCHLGYGVKAQCQEQIIRIGSHRFMVSEHIVMPLQVEQLVEQCREIGHGLLFVALDDTLIGAIELQPTIRPEAKETIQALKRLKSIKKIYIISGDAEAPTRRLAQELSIEHYYAHTLPQEKASRIRQLQQEGAFVCFIGDGINDSIAMKQAQVSISLSGATQLASDTAQILLLDGGIRHLPRLFELAQRFNQHMQRQSMMILAPSMAGVSMICLAGWGMSRVMLLSIGSLVLTIGYSLLDHPKSGSTSPNQKPR